VGRVQYPALTNLLNFCHKTGSYRSHNKKKLTKQEDQRKSQGKRHKKRLKEEVRKINPKQEIEIKKRHLRL
jgi:hypothetical protein